MHMTLPYVMRRNREHRAKRVKARRPYRRLGTTASLRAGLAWVGGVSIRL